VLVKSNGTPVYTRQHKRGLTLSQQSAVDLLVGGKTDKETAELLNLSRTCVTKWRLYDPVFQAALNRRRAEVWAVGIDLLRSLVPKALDVLAGELESGNASARLKAAREILHLAQLPAGGARIGPTDAEEIVRGVVEARRSRARGTLDNLQESDKNLPDFEQHMEETWKELEDQANQPGE
jgi:hypothetical protein